MSDSRILFGRAIVCGCVWASLSVLAFDEPLARRVVRIDARIEGSEAADGLAGVALWTASNGFPEDIQHAVATTYVPIIAGEALATFDELAPGSYAVIVYHDKNNNQEFDKNWFGMPREAWGVSNNARPRLRAPLFEEASFELTAGVQSIDISIR